MPENYSIPALPTSSSNSTAKTFDAISDAGDRVHVVAKTADGSKTQAHEFTTVIGDVIEGIQFFISNFEQTSLRFSK